MRFIKNGSNCKNCMLLCSGQYYMYIAAFLSSLILYHIYHIDSALQTEMRKRKRTAGGKVNIVG